MSLFSKHGTWATTVTTVGLSYRTTSYRHLNGLQNLMYEFYVPLKSILTRCKSPLHIQYPVYLMTYELALLCLFMCRMQCISLPPPRCGLFLFV